MASHTHEELSSQILRLNAEIAELRRRVSALEHTAEPEAPAVSEELPHAAVTGAAVTPAENPAPLFGWALLGLSGAYFFRALSESGAIPSAVGAAAGLLYAAVWLAMAARRAWDKPLAATVQSLTAAIVVAPLLWESTVRLKLIGPPAATAILIAFVIFGLAVAWRHSVNGIAWVVTLAGLVTLFAVFRETQDGRAWAVGVLAIAAGVEFSACRDHWLGLRWLAALNADFTVLALTLVVGRGSGAMLTPMYVLGLQMALLAIYIASTADRTLIRKLPITGFEIAQAVLAFLAGVGGALFLADAANLSQVAVGLFCLGFSVLCYLISFAILDHSAERRRNFHTYSVFAVALMLVACLLLASPAGAAVAFAGLSAVTVRLATRTALRVQSAVFLAAAILVSGAIPAAIGALIHSPSYEPLFPGSAYLAALLASGVYYLHGRDPSRVEAFVSALMFVWLCAGAGAVWLPPAAARTGLLALLSVGAAALAVRTSRAELAWTSYVLLGAAGVKLLVEDMRLARSFGVFGSLLLFGGALILAPRILRGRAG